jgi:hypothetical protein
MSLSWLGSHIGWLIVNIAIPIGAPICAMTGLKLFPAEGPPDEAKWKRSIWVPFRDGQLAFLAIGWIAAAAYELVNERTLVAKNLPEFGEGVVVGMLGLATAFSALCVTGGAVFPAEFVSKTKPVANAETAVVGSPPVAPPAPVIVVTRAANWKWNYRWALLSILATALSALPFLVVYSAVHS